jgi:hypothetical protein
VLLSKNLFEPMCLLLGAVPLLYSVLYEFPQVISQGGHFRNDPYSVVRSL